ncbi:MAG: GDSL-type esterase/lipase family protein [Pirellulaceae bacterium]
MRVPKRWYQRLMLLVTLGAGILALVVASGAIDRLSHDGDADKSLALRALGIYWGLSLSLLLVLGHVKTHGKQLLLLVGSTLVAVGGAELSLRVLAPHLCMPRYQSQHSVEFHHAMPTRETMHFGLIGGKHVFVQTNEDGLRSQYDREQFRQSDIRIACLGDSFTFGYGVQGEDSYPARLQHQLRGRLGQESVAVLNAGVTSYSPLLEDRLLRRVVRHYEPQVVLLMIDCTDIGDDYQYAGELMRPGARDGDFAPRETASQGTDLGAVWRLTERWRDTEALKVPIRLLGRFGNRQPPPVYDYYSFEAPVGNVSERNRFFIFRHPLADTRSYFDRSWSYIERVAATCEELDARLVVVISPRFHHWNRQECPNNWEESEYLRDGPYQYEFFRFFKEQASTAPFDVRSLLPEFQACEQFPLVFDSDPHWNRAGHQFVAQTLSNLLVDELQVFEEAGAR